MYNPLFSFLRPQRFFGSGEAGGANDSSNDNDSGSGNSFTETMANLFTPNDGMSYVDGNLVNDSDNTPVAISTPTAAPASSSDDDDRGGGYTSLADMFDGGGAGGSGSEFYSGSHADYEDTAAGAADAASDAAGTTNYESGSYTSVTDMLDGGGPGMSGDTFAGPVSDISTGLGATPLGSGIEPTGVAGFINSGGITGALVNALAGGIDTVTGAGTTAQPGETSSPLAPETSITPMARPDDLGTGTSDSESTGYTRDRKSVV